MNFLNRYRNPWFQTCGTPRPEFYENNARRVFSYRGVDVFALPQGFDYVTGGCCITQRHGFDKQAAPAIIDQILSGETLVADAVADHLCSMGFDALGYSGKRIAKKAA